MKFAVLQFFSWPGKRVPIETVYERAFQRIDVMERTGYDAVWLGVIITVMIEIGQVTPPVGLNLSVLVSVTKEQVSLGDAAIATIPYWLILLAGVALLAAFPAIALYLPSVMM